MQSISPARIRANLCPVLIKAFIRRMSVCIKQTNECILFHRYSLLLKEALTILKVSASFPQPFRSRLPYRNPTVGRLSLLSSAFAAHGNMPIRRESYAAQDANRTTFFADHLFRV